VEKNLDKKIEIVSENEIGLTKNQKKKKQKKKQATQK